MTSREDVLQVKDDFKAMTSYASTLDNGRDDVVACALTTEYNFMKQVEKRSMGSNYESDRSIFLSDSRDIGCKWVEKKEK